MNYNVEIIADSVGPNGVRLITMLTRYARSVHSEVLRHRQFSHSVKSSRAKPVITYLREVWSDPYEPVYWGANKKGMQAGAEIKNISTAKLLWRIGRYVELGLVYGLNKLGVHKQVANRRLEADLFVDDLITGTESAFYNFYNLRCGLDGAADPAIQKIARMMARAHKESTPKTIRAGEWHLPFISSEDIYECAARHAYDDNPDKNINNELCKVSAARCARLSYYSYTTNKISTIDEDLKLYDKLYTSKHFSPMEHIAQALPLNSDYQNNIQVYKDGGNLIGWKQLRKTFTNEVNNVFDLSEITNEEFVIA